MQKKNLCNTLHNPMGRKNHLKKARKNGQVPARRPPVSSATKVDDLPLAREYMEFTGFHPLDKRYAIFTESELVEKTAKELAFSYTYRGESDPNRLLVVQHVKQGVLRKMCGFQEDVSERVYQRAQDIIKEREGERFNPVDFMVHTLKR